MRCSRSSTGVFHVEEVKPKFGLDSTNRRGSVVSRTEAETQGLQGAREWMVARLILSESRSAKDGSPDARSAVKTSPDVIQGKLFQTDMTGALKTARRRRRQRKEDIVVLYGA